MRTVKYISVDVEADGPIPGKYSMIQLGACVVGGKETFLRNVAPISNEWVPEALGVSGFTREQCYTFTDANTVMYEFAQWLDSLTKDGSRVQFVSDNAGFDWMFVCYYLWTFVGRNPFGFSCTSITSLYKGYANSMQASFKHLRTTKHTHNALDDARGNAGALVRIMDLLDKEYESAV